MYSMLYDIFQSTEKRKLQLIKGNDVIKEITGIDTVNFIHTIDKIEFLKEMGLEYKSLDFDDSVNEWYEIVLVEPGTFCEGVTLVYHPHEDEFEVPEISMKWKDIKKTELFIKAFKNEKSYYKNYSMPKMQR